MALLAPWCRMAKNFEPVPSLRREIIVRGQSYFFRLPKYWPPISLSARRVCPPPATKAGGTHSLGVEGDGGSIFWKTREIGLPSYNDLSTLLSSWSKNCKWGHKQNVKVSTAYWHYISFIHNSTCLVSTFKICWSNWWRLCSCSSCAAPTPPTCDCKDLLIHGHPITSRPPLLRPPPPPPAV